MIPTPFQGILYDYGAKIKLTRELVKDLGTNTVELKVIAVVEGMIPSEVSSHIYEVQENLRPILVQPAHEIMTRAVNKGSTDVTALQAVV